MAIDLKAGIDHAAFVRDVEKGMKLANRALSKRANTVKLKLDDKGFRQPLGRITGDLNMFDSALAASNARVIAFGASTAVIGGISKAFKELAQTTVLVGKQFADINRILSLSNKNFEKFGNQLFEISKKNATSFQDTTKAALEFARQGLKTEETLKRTSDALTLVRLTGINADKAVATLTATVNAFEGTMLDTTTAVNKFVAVETKFAVGARDLVEAIGRVGSSARDAKVGFDELNAMVTSVQQTTGRGGAVIGNAMKTIFTRLQRQSTLDALSQYNVAVKDIQGNTLPAMQILDNFAKSYAGLTDSSQAYLREQVAGVFQANILSAILKDLNKQQSTYSRALVASTSATDQANQATDELNRTLSALVSQTGLEFQRLQQNIGKATFEPIARELLAPLKDLMKGINDVIDGEGAGSEVANGLLKGIKNVLGGPGLVAALGLIGKVFFNTTSYMLKSLPALAGITTETQKRAQLEKQVESILQRESGLALAIQGYTGDTAMQAKLLADYAQMAADDMDRQESSVAGIAATLMRMPKGALNVAAVTSGGTGGRRGASGFIPGMAGEIHDIKKGVGGVSPSARPVAIPNFAFGGGVRGTMVANTGEHIVPNFKGGGSAIFNPNMIAQYGMPAGAKPIRGAGGYVPNFVDVNKANAARLAAEAGITPESSPSYFNKSGGVKVALLRDNLQRKAASRTAQGRFFDARQKAHMFVPRAGFKMENYPYVFGADSALRKMSSTVSKDGKPVDGMLLNAYGPSLTASKKVQKGGNLAKVEDILEDSLRIAAENVIMAYSPALHAGKPVSKTKVEGSFLKEGGAGAMGAFKGALFEAVVDRLVGQQYEKGKQNTSTLDILLSGQSGRNAEDLFGITGTAVNATHADAKSSWSSGNRTKITEQIMKNFGKSLPITMGAAAKGYVPNFAALGNAVEREAAAGVPLGSIRVGRSSRLAGPNNPAGLGVTNTRDEPRGLADVVGASRGYVPNFASPADFLKGVVSSKNPAYNKVVQMMEQFGQELTEGKINQDQYNAKVKVATQKMSMNSSQMSKVNTAAGKFAVATETAAKAAKTKKGGGMLSAGGGMGVGLGLAMGLPMAAGMAEQFGAGSKTTSAMSGAGTGASLGMMFGPKAAVAGAFLGGIVGFGMEAMKAGKSAEELAASLEELNKATQETTSAGENYIKAQEDLLAATSRDQLADAQKRLAENFEKIKGTALESEFEKAGSNVKGLASALATFVANTAGQKAARRAIIGGQAFDLQDTRSVQKTYATGNRGGQVVTGTYRTTQDFFGPKSNEAFMEQFGSMFVGDEGKSFFLPQQLEAIQKQAKIGFKGIGDPAIKELAATFKANVPGFEDLDAEEIESMFSKDFLKALEHITKIVPKMTASAQAAANEADKGNNKMLELVDSFQAIERGVNEANVIMKTSPLQNFKKAFEKLNSAFGSVASDVQRTAGDLVGAAQSRASSGILSRRVSATQTRNMFGLDAASQVVKAFEGAVNTSTEGLAALRDITGKLATDPRSGLVALENALAEFTPTGVKGGAFRRVKELDPVTGEETGKMISAVADPEKFQKLELLGKTLKAAFDQQEMNIAADRLIGGIQSNLTVQRARITEQQRDRNAEEKTNIEQRSRTLKLEEINLKSRLNAIELERSDTRRNVGLTNMDMLRRQQQLDQKRLAAEQNMLDVRAKNEKDNLNAEFAIQTALIESNHSLIGAEKALEEAVNNLAIRMIGSTAPEPTRDEYEEALSEAEFRKMDSFTFDEYKQRQRRNYAQRVMSETEAVPGGTASGDFKDSPLYKNALALRDARIKTIDDVNAKEKQQQESNLKNTQDQALILEREKTEFKKGLRDGFDEVFKDIDNIYNRLGKDLPTAFRDGMVGAMESAMDKAESFGDAMRGVAIDMLKMMRRAALEHSMSNFTSLIGMGTSSGFRKSQRGSFVPGSGTGDKVPAMLEPGEYVVNSKAVKGVGRSTLDQINFGAFPRFGQPRFAQSGGMMGIDESVHSNRMSGFFLASDNPELAEAREAERARLAEKAQKKAQKKQLLSTFLSTVVSMGVGKLMSMGADKFGKKGLHEKGATGELTVTQNRNTVMTPLGPAPLLGKNKLPEFPQNQKGGHIGRGFTNRDSVPAYMAGGEFVMNNRAVRKYGLGFMGRLNGGLIPTMQAGGPVTPAPLNSQTGANTNNISISVNTGGGGGTGQGGSQSTGNASASQQSNVDQATQGKELAERIRAAVLEVVSTEQRIGGSLSKHSRV